MIRYIDLTVYTSPKTAPIPYARPARAIIEHSPKIAISLVLHPEVFAFLIVGTRTAVISITESTSEITPPKRLFILNHPP